MHKDWSSFYTQNYNGKKKEKYEHIWKKDIFTSQGIEEFIAYSAEFQNEFLRKFLKTIEMTKVNYEAWTCMTQHYRFCLKLFSVI